MTKLYRVAMRETPAAKWTLWTNYPTEDDARLAAKSLVWGGHAYAAEVIEVGITESRQIARYTASPDTRQPMVREY